MIPLQRDPWPLLILYSRRHRNSLHALLGALTSDQGATTTPIFLFPTERLLLEELPKYGRSLLVCSLMSVDAQLRRGFFQKVQSVNPRVLIAAGGPHITAGDPATEEGCAWIVRGEGEAAFIEIVRRFQSGDCPERTQVLTGGPVDLNRYPPFPRNRNMIGPIELRRGCPHGCSFCQTSTLFGWTIRERSPEAVFEAVRLLNHLQRAIDLRFVTPNAFGYRSVDGITPNPQAIHEFLLGLRKIIGNQGRIYFGSFPSEVRPDSITPEILTIVRHLTDNHRLVIGAQSGSDRSLARLKRGHTREDVLTGVELARSAGFETIVDFIFGLPEETEEDIRETVETIGRLIQCGAKIHAHAFLPLPGTAYADQPPRPIDQKLRRFLGTLARQGHLFGQWQTQEVLARQLIQN
ncbi:MAG TPA: TIGR04013 family B12-binding domain/radical SAM domain-containing protein [Atribacteraceae bacterium]|nr:TIGR04013 family B12-binding domain/radical SAM domain-containing protein [Atribacteraceae bacterium]